MTFTVLSNYYYCLFSFSENSKHQIQSQVPQYVKTSRSFSAYFFFCTLFALITGSEKYASFKSLCSLTVSHYFYCGLFCSLVNLIHLIIPHDRR